MEVSEMAKENESEYGGVGGILTPVGKGTPMRPEWEQKVAMMEEDPSGTETLVGGVAPQYVVPS
jgi:hypothetical protein